MSKRKILKEADPEAFEAMMGFERYLAQGSLTKIHAGLLKISASHMNNRY